MKVLGFIVYIVASVLPKFKWAVIQTYPSFDDNVLEIERFLVDKDISKVVILIPDFDLPENNFKFSNKVIFRKRKSLVGIFYFIFSKYVFITHGLYYWKFSRNQISINLWHGMPLKKIGVEKGKKGIITSYTLSCSKVFNEALANAFSISEKSILNIGLPRIFRLLENARNTEFKKSLCSDNEKIIVWLPTYRSSIEGDIRVDGFDFGNVVNMQSFDMDNFNNFLISNKISCYIKPHPMSKIYNQIKYSNIHIINDNWLYEKGCSLYDLLSQADILISDISSVIVDFLVLNRPIIFSFQDKSEYVNSRGVYSYFNVDDLPGDLCVDAIELKNAIINNFENKNLYEFKRLRLLNKYHENLDKFFFENELKKVLRFNC